jgi:hypothetical protein
MSEASAPAVNVAFLGRGTTVSAETLHEQLRDHPPVQRAARGVVLSTLQDGLFTLDDFA